MKATISFLLMFALIAVSGLSDAHAQATRTTLQIEKAKSSWKLFAETQTRFTIEGRLRSRSDENLSLVGSSLKFQMNPDVNFPRLTAMPRAISMKGYFEVREGKPAFRVESVDRATDRFQVFRDAQFALKDDDVAGWKALAEETEEYARFYDDNQLLEKAREAWHSSIRAERLVAVDITPERMENWIKRLEEHGVSARVVDEWTHDMLWMHWKAIREDLARRDLTKFAGQLAEELPHARELLETPQPKLLAEYLERPERTYDLSDDAQRKKLQRLFYMEVLKAEILKAAHPEGANGAQIAARFKDALPEMPELAEKFVELGLTYRLEHLDTAGRDEAIALAREFREQGDEEKSRDALRRWLEHRLKIWRNDGADGFIRAAREHVDLLEDRARAYELLKQAWTLDRERDEIEKEFAALGYRLHEGRWITTAEFEKIPPDEMKQAASEGKVLPGMPPSLVIQALGKPTRQLHSFSAGHVSQVWIYEGQSERKLTIHLIRSAGALPENSQVVAIGETR